MSRLSKRILRAIVVLAVVGAIVPANALAAGPVRDGTGTPGRGEPDNDTQLSIFTES
jgi:hypothetical protein